MASEFSFIFLLRDMILSRAAESTRPCNKSTTLVLQNKCEFQEDLELHFKLFVFVDFGSAYIVLEKSE